MYHSRWKDSHYEAGLRYGSRLFKHGIDLLANIQISSERREFAAKCIPLYQQYYPEILEEIRGLTDGLQSDFQDMTGFLLSMYCYEFENKCSCFAFSREGKTIFGRNSDFVTSIEKLCDSAYYKLDHTYSFIGNTTAWIQMEDGVNEHGLAAGLTFIYPTTMAPGLHAGMLVRYILEKCKTTREAIHALQTLPIASAQTITLLDRSGDMAVIESNCDKVVVIRPKQGEDFVFTTNHFTSPEMQPYRQDEDDCRSQERYETLVHAFKKCNDYSVEFAKELLSGKHGFMCQYDRRKGLDTVWSSIVDLTENKIYRAEGNPGRKSYKEEKRLRFGEI